MASAQIYETRTQRRRRRHREIRDLCAVLCHGGPKYNRSDLLAVRDLPVMKPLVSLDLKALETPLAFNPFGDPESFVAIEIPFLQPSTYLDFQIGADGEHMFIPSTVSPCILPSEEVVGESCGHDGTPFSLPDGHETNIARRIKEAQNLAWSKCSQRTKFFWNACISKFTHMSGSAAVSKSSTELTKPRTAAVVRKRLYTNAPREQSVETERENSEWSMDVSMDSSLESSLERASFGPTAPGPLILIDSEISKDERMLSEELKSSDQEEGDFEDDLFPTEMLPPILEMAHALPEERQAAFVFIGFRGIASRHNLAHDQYLIELQELEQLMGVTLVQTLPFICQECSCPHPTLLPTCRECGHQDLFDMRKCVCGHIGLCEIGSRKGDDSDSDISDGSVKPQFTYIENPRQHFGREFGLRCDYCMQSMAPTDDAWLCLSCKSCLVHAESFGRCKEKHSLRHAEECREIEQGMYLLENLEVAEASFQKWEAEQVLF